MKSEWQSDGFVIAILIKAVLQTILQLREELRYLKKRFTLEARMQQQSNTPQSTITADSSIQVNLEWCDNQCDTHQLIATDTESKKESAECMHVSSSPAHLKQHCVDTGAQSHLSDDVEAPSQGTGAVRVKHTTCHDVESMLPNVPDSCSAVGAVLVMGIGCQAGDSTLVHVPVALENDAEAVCVSTSDATCQVVEEALGPVPASPTDEDTALEVTEFHDSACQTDAQEHVELSSVPQVPSSKHTRLVVWRCCCCRPFFTPRLTRCKRGPKQYQLLLTILRVVCMQGKSQIIDPATERNHISSVAIIPPCEVGSSIPESSTQTGVSLDTLQQLESVLQYLTSYPKSCALSTSYVLDETTTPQKPGSRAAQESGSGALAVIAYISHLTSTIATLLTSRAPPSGAFKEQVFTGCSMSKNGLVFSTQGSSNGYAELPDVTYHGGTVSSSGRRFHGFKQPPAGSVSAAVHSLSAMNDQLAVENQQLILKVAAQQTATTVCPGCPVAQCSCSCGVVSKSDAELSSRPNPVQMQSVDGSAGSRSESTGVQVDWDAMPAILGCGTWQKLLEGMLCMLRTVETVHASAVSLDRCDTALGINGTGTGTPCCSQKHNDVENCQRLVATEACCGTGESTSHVQVGEGAAKGPDGRVILAIAKVAVFLQQYVEQLQGQLVTSIASGVPPDTFFKGLCISHIASSPFWLTLL